VFEPATSGTAVVVAEAIAGVAVIVVIPTELIATARIAIRPQDFFDLIRRGPLKRAERPKIPPNTLLRMLLPIMTI
jgi:hypothetical protein